MSEITITVLPSDKLVRGPGGHWYRYVARWSDRRNTNRGYGDTGREAELDLKKQEGN